MSSYYGDRPRDIPSWDSLDRADEDEIVRSEASPQLIVTNGW